MGWLSSIGSGFAALAKWAFAWWTDRQAEKHDALVRQSQQTEDALKGSNDAIKQVDRVGVALDAPDSGMRDDPENRSR